MPLTFQPYTSRLCRQVQKYFKLGRKQAVRQRDTIKPLPPLFRFLLPSSVGVLLFLLPVSIDGRSTILLGVITDLVKLPLQPYALEIISAVIWMSALSALCYRRWGENWEQSHPALYAFSGVTRGWFVMRMVAAFLAVLVFFGLGPEAIWGVDTGRLAFEASGPSILYILFAACFLMPFLTEFGFMEFVGTLVERPFSRFFRLPGRAAIDATASFVSASMVGMMISISQYRLGFYSAREASIIATNFSIVSLPFCLVMASVAGVEEHFFSWYAVVVFSCLTCALVLCRVPPLARIPDTYFTETDRSEAEVLSRNHVVARAFAAAVTRAENAEAPGLIASRAWHSALGLVSNVLGASMLIATITLVLVHHTPVFEWMSYPIYFLMETAGIAQAKLAAIAVLVGFFDVFAPVLLIRSVEAEATRFIVAGVAVSQIIYMSDLGALILRSGLPLPLPRLFLIFVLRTLIVLPLFIVASALLL
ncbi:MAG: YjiH family protein [Gammaproteobacteria bacterium]|jgi:nucleoside recognition membrane protein YjiH|nr:YjiH family protein [Gammaproteobacteria bacterium]MBT7541205.1 YjiH family protein [Gammaproteobacteria bacterium]MDC1018285.1 nucleoside recognition domain-containing protein [Pseudomonadales bacterium]